ncbi:hypothetical protein [Rhizosphaericola mali]|uniref:Glycosyltransferase family 4 protein n=1 Tax=Rhizosphaericola mali TaxID=2545455 RepID=A0A5P2G995_9BACT|nr:hypothetical protein [Rhizosphaericola mali]QES90522.1 hypothetical protein E0W69_018285 [Rhizosphaericola mali]
MAKKIVLLGMPESYGLSMTIVQELQKMDFLVVDISFKDYGFQYKNWKQKIISWYNKKIKGNKHFKNDLKFAPYKSKIDSIIDSYEKFDYALFIRADIYPKYILDKVRRKTRKFIGYQWDGLSRYPRINEYIPLFDKFFVFDKEDAFKNNRVIPITNFYIEKECDNVLTPIKRAIFLGSFFKDRYDILITIQKLLHEKKIDFDIFLLGAEAKNSIADKLTFEILKSPLPYNNYLSTLMKYDIIIDLPLSIHHGFSFRVLEALGLEKKLITTNSSLMQADFYDKNNIFVLNQHNKEDIILFLEKPYKKLDKSIKEKYNFKNWINTLLMLDNE